MSSPLVCSSNPLNPNIGYIHGLYGLCHGVYTTDDYTMCLLNTVSSSISHPGIALGCTILNYGLPSNLNRFKPYHAYIYSDSFIYLHQMLPYITNLQCPPQCVWVNTNVSSYRFQCE